MTFPSKIAVREVSNKEPSETPVEKVVTVA
jgi:hypothetical protein